MPPIPRNRRDYIARDTLRRSFSIIAETSKQGASAHSTFIPEQLPSLDQTDCPDPFGTPVRVEVVNSDTLAVARKLLSDDGEAIGNVAALNLADDIRPAGSWLLHDMPELRQEECLCYSSTLYVTLKDTYYPFPNVGPDSAVGIYSPGVVIFRDQLENACADLPVDQRRVVSVISVAAPRWPQLSSNGKFYRRHSDLEDLREKIRLVYRVAAYNEKRYLILGAMGCGAYGNPPEQVAREMRDILMESEFRGWFKKIVFAVLSTTNNERGNFEVFRDTFAGVRI
ncbi:hypothetical protein VNI00_011147 [Paramarasmius palmivorus]|uniref:Microbial-type PARG catalytic domain-containing protein n=1 Tax=Paramarasmius palmivorus TaxID=297713 RepID=A0AAW0CEH0_9AGAR